MFRVSVSTLLAFVTVQLAHGHGRMTNPRARNGADNGAVAGGPGTVHTFGSNGIQSKYQHGICGNAFGHRQTYNKVGPVVATYNAGSTIEITVQITAHHVGYFEFDFCDDAGQLSEACFSKHRLLREGCSCSCPSGDVSNSCAECNKCRWFWKAPMQGELSQTVLQGYDGPVLAGAGNLLPYDFTMHYVLPSGIKTSHGVLRWHYMTTNSCTTASSAPEEFWNCADVAIADGTGSTGVGVVFDNEALENLPVSNLAPMMQDGTLTGVNSACPVADGLLQGYGPPSEYLCGQEDGAGSFEHCKAVSGSSAGFDCSGVPEGEIRCTEECGAFFYQCANGVAFMKPTAKGALCKSDIFVVEAACSDLAPTSTPAPTPVSTAPSTSTPTVAPVPTVSTTTPSVDPPSFPSACSGALNGGCSGCLATNNVCYAQPKDWCDAFTFTWCGASLLQSSKAQNRHLRGLSR